MNPEEFSEAIDDALPPQPITKGWGAKARRRSRNRRAAAVTGVVGAVVVAVVAVSSQLSGQPTMTATPAPADSSPQDPTPVVAEICQGLHDDAFPHELPNDGRMPEGAEEVWICGGKGLGQWGDVNLVAVAEPLTLDVEEAVAAFNAEPTATMAIDCDGVQSEMFDVVYAYPDGTRYVAQVHRGRTPEVGCRHISVGGWLRFESQAFVAELAELWQRQRAAQGTAFVPGDDVCPDSASVFDVSPKEATSGFVCLPVDDDSGEAVQIRLSDDLVADIAAEIEVTGDGPEPGLERSAPSLVLQNEHGDPFTIFGTPGDGYHWYPPRDAGGMQIWRPSQEIRERMLAEIDASRVVEPDGPADSSSPATPDEAESTTTTTTTDPPTVPFTAEDVEQAWFDDAELAALPSSVRDSVEIGRESYATLGLEPGDVEVEVGSSLDDLVRIRTEVTVPGGVEPGWVEYHRLLEGNESEGVFSPAGEHCFVTGQDFLEQGSVPDAVPEGGLPDHPEFVALCLTGLLEAKSRPLGVGTALISSESGGAQAAVDGYNSLPFAGAECRAKDGAWGLIVFHYGDGTEYVLQIRDNSCGSIVASNEHRSGGGDYLAALGELTDG